jgi:hypothetical protein
MAVIDRMPWAQSQSNSQFKSIPIDAMRAGVRRACIKAGLVHVGPLDLRYEMTVRETKNGGVVRFYTGTGTFRYVNVDDPSDYIDYEAVGEAMDSGDKGLSKFVTFLLKNHYKAAFDIGENDDPDRYSYAEEDLMAAAEEKAERRRRNQDAARQDPFFGDDRAPLRKRIGAMMSQDKEEYVEGAAPIVEGYKAQHGLMTQWSKEVLEQCIRDIEHVGEVKAAKDAFWGKEAGA